MADISMPKASSDYDRRVRGRICQRSTAFAARDEEQMLQRRSGGNAEGGDISIFSIVAALKEELGASLTFSLA